MKVDQKCYKIWKCGIWKHFEWFSSGQLSYCPKQPGNLSNLACTGYSGTTWTENQSALHFLRLTDQGHTIGADPDYGFMLNLWKVDF